MPDKDNKKANPLSAYGVTDKEFAFYEKLYNLERKSYWKGVLVGYLIAMGGYILSTIIMSGS